MEAQRRSLVLAAVGALLLGACGGHGSGVPPGTPPAAIAVVPFPGSFSGGCSVTLLASDGSVIASATLDPDGSATLPTGFRAGPLIIQLRGAADCRYYDSANDRDASFGPDETLGAVIDEVRSPVGINLLTHLAASRLLDGDGLAAGIGAADIRRENATVGLMFQSGDILQAASPIRSRDDRIAFDSPGRLAVRLAALAEVARNLARPFGGFVADLTADFRDDGILNTVPIDTARLRTGLDAAAARLSDAESMPRFALLAPNTTLSPASASVQPAVAQVLAAGPALAHAQQLFAALRGSGLSVAGNAGTTAEAASVLETGFQSAVATDRLLGDLRFASEVAREVSAISNSYLTSDTSFCNVGGALGLCRMHWSFHGQGYTVILKRLGDTRVSWTVPLSYYSIFWNYDADGMTGAFTLSGDTTLLGGHYLPMTGNARRTAVDLVLDRTSGAGGTPQWHAYGTLNAVLADDVTSMLKAVLGSAVLDPSARINRLTTTQSGPTHRFEGSAELTGLTPSLDGVDSSPAGGRLSGQFSGTGTNPPRLAGSLGATQDWSAYDATKPVSATNFPALRWTFDGTLWPRAGSAGIAVSLSADNTSGQTITSAHFDITGSSSPLAGTGTRTNGAWNWTFTGDGVSAGYASAGAAGSVTRADGLTLGSIAAGVVRFIDGSVDTFD